MNIFKAEKLKIKNGRMLTYSFVLPMLCGVFALFFGGTWNILHQSIYWWMGVFLPALLQIIAYRNLSIEKRAGDFFHLKTSAGNIGEIYLAKTIWSLYYGFLGTLWMLLIIFFFHWSMPHNGLIKDPLQIVSGMWTVYATSLWTVPVFFLLSQKFKPMLLILLQFLISFLAAPFAAGSKFFLLLPHTYPFKPAKVFFSIKEAGDLLQRPVIRTDYAEMWVVIASSLLLFVVLSFILYKRGRKNVEHR